MPDTDPDQRIDLDTLTDDEVKALGPEQVQALMEQENRGDYADEPEVNAETLPDTDDDVEHPDVDADTQGETSQKDPDPDAEDPAQAPGIDPKAPATAPEITPGTTDPAKREDAKPAKPYADPEPKKESKADAVPAVDSAAAVDFFTKVSAPFKADGRDIQVRTAEDVIRLMQMGVNYSRRMQEMKPMRAIDQMLREHGLNDIAKLNELIDISKGNPAAIQKLLKDKQIDPLDIDTSKENPYKATNYQKDPKDIAFQDAIDSTMAANGGRELIQDINKEWDNSSKEALRDQPSIFQNLLDQKDSGVYAKVKTELQYQKTMGFLTDVPFIQAYHQVADAMQKAGVFGSPTQQVQSGSAPAPIDTGTRKAALKPKSEQPNPNLSSTTQPRIAPPSNDGSGQSEPDYSSMSDADFLKMAPPG